MVKHLSFIHLTQIGQSENMSGRGHLVAVNVEGDNIKMDLK
jgi:hypothetical protein